MKRLNPDAVKIFAGVGAATAFLTAATDLLSDAPALVPIFFELDAYLEIFGISLAFFAAACLLASPFFLAISVLTRIPPLATASAMAAGVYSSQAFLLQTDDRSYIPTLVMMGGGLAIGWLLALLMNRSPAWARFLSAAPLTVVISSIAFVGFYWFSQFGGRETAKLAPHWVALGWAAIVIILLWAIFRRITLEVPKRIAVAAAAVYLASFVTPLFRAPRFPPSS
jgi:hypothetical protein